MSQESLADVKEFEPSTSRKEKRKVTLNEPASELIPIPPIDKVKVTLTYVKIYTIFVVWLIFTICLMIQKVKVHEYKLVAIKSGAKRDYSISEEKLSGLIGIDISGPFVSEAQTANIKEGKEGNYLKLQMQRVHYDANKKEIERKGISEIWKVHIVQGENYDYVVPVRRSHVFEMQTANNWTAEAKNSELYLNMLTNVAADVTLRILIDKSPVNKDLGIVYGSIVLIFMYAMVVFEIIDRTIASMISAILALGVLAALGARPSLHTIISWVDMETIMLLFGMMILVSILSDSGIFYFFAVYAYEISKGHIWPLITSLCFFTALLSAFLDNVTMLLLISPIVINLCEATSLDPGLVLIFLDIYSNVGAAATPIGDPPNIIITTNSFVVKNGVNFGNFMLHTLPCVIAALIQTHIQLRLTFRNASDMQAPNTESAFQEDLTREINMWERASARVVPTTNSSAMVRLTLSEHANRLKRELDSPYLEVKQKDKKTGHKYDEILTGLKSTYGIRDKILLIKSLIAFVFVISLFFLHSIKDLHQLSLGWTALIGAILLLILVDNKDLQSILSRIEWATLIFFASLFILMEALSRMGLIELLGDFVTKIILLASPEYRLMTALLIILWVTAISSAFLDNIPVTTMMLRIVSSLSQQNELGLPLHPMIWALALGACFGGNGTLIGASANVVSAGIAEKHGYKLSFMKFFRIGFPVMIGNVIVATIYILLAHVVFKWHD